MEWPKKKSEDSQPSRPKGVKKSQPSAEGPQSPGGGTHSTGSGDQCNHPQVVEIHNNRICWKVCAICGAIVSVKTPLTPVSSGLVQDTLRQMGLAPAPLPTKTKLRELIQEGMKQAVMEHIPGKPLGYYQVECVARVLERHYGF